MPARSRTAPALAGLGLSAAALVAGAIPAAATTPPPGPSPRTFSVAVPVTCTFAPENPNTSKQTATVVVTAPTTTIPGATPPLAFEVDLPVMQSVPMDVTNFGFTSHFTTEGSAGPTELTLVQAPVSARTGERITPERFTPKVTAGAAGSTIAYRFVGVDYTFRLAGWTSDAVARCTPDAGPTTVTTTAVNAPATGGTSWLQRLIALLRALFRPPGGPTAPAPAAP